MAQQLTTNHPQPTTNHPLRNGDKVAIISPATVVKPEYVDGAAEFLRREGFVPVVMPHAKGPASGSFAASDADRLADFTAAWSDPEVRAILCARGGYGCNHLLPHISRSLLQSDPKWLIGFSDVSALHALLFNAGIQSIHGPMAKHLTEEDPDHFTIRAMMRILREGPEVEYFAAPDPRNIRGEAEGILVGGNLAVLNGLADTPYDILKDVDSTPLILFIEDISEAIYAVERMLIRLLMGGKIQKLQGLVIGQFTEYRPDLNHPDMETMISRLLQKWEVDIPVAFGFPTGHVADNVPLVEGARTHLSVTDEATILTQQR